MMSDNIRHQKSARVKLHCAQALGALCGTSDLRPLISLEQGPESGQGLCRAVLPRLRDEGGFTLLELLSVIGVIAILLALIGPALTTITSGTDVSSAIYGVKEALENARAYAKVNHTYVFVGVSEVDSSIDPSISPQVTTGGTPYGRVAVAAVASKDGTSQYAWLSTSRRWSGDPTSITTLKPPPPRMIAGSVPDERDPTTGSHTAIIEYGGGFVLGWENENDPSSLGYDVDKDPYAWIIDPNTGSTKPRPATIPIVLNHPLSNVGEFDYGLDTANSFQPLSFVTETSNDKAVLDFFTYNPILHTYPRAGILNFNTRNVTVLAAALKAALKNDTIAPPSSSGVISASEATTAAQRIVDETKLRPVLNRGDVARLVRVGADAAWTKEQKEAVARALAEIGQARTWNLMIDLIAQTGKCAPGETDFTKFIVQGEKRYWLHIALGRDLNADRTVDVLGAQLEEVSE